MAQTTEARKKALSPAAQAAQKAQGRVVPRLNGAQAVEGTVTTIDAIMRSARARMIAETMAHAQKYPNSPWSGAGLVRLEKTVREFYNTLGNDIKDAFKQSLPQVMLDFFNRAKAAIAADGGTELIGEPSTARIQYFLNSAFEQVAMRTDKMRFDHIQHLRRVASQVMRETALTGETRREVSKRLLADATSVQGWQFTDKAGRKWRNKSYFEMLARTELMNAGRAAYEDAAVEAGYDVFQLSFSGDSCEACARWEGRLFSLTGATRGLPTKEDLEEDGVFHPNCTHSYSAVPDYIRETRFDENGKPLTEKEQKKRKEQTAKENEDWLKEFDRKLRKRK